MPSIADERAELLGRLYDAEKRLIFYRTHYQRLVGGNQNCCCVLADDDTVLEACAMHKAWRDAAIEFAIEQAKDLDSR